MAMMSVCIIGGKHRIPTDKAKERHWILTTNRTNDTEASRVLVALTAVSKLIPNTFHRKNVQNQRLSVKFNE